MSALRGWWNTKTFSNDLPLLYTEEAARRIGKLDKGVKERVGKAIKKLSEQPS